MQSSNPQPASPSQALHALSSMDLQAENAMLRQQMQHIQELAYGSFMKTEDVHQSLVVIKWPCGFLDEDGKLISHTDMDWQVLPEQCKQKIYCTDCDGKTL